MWLKQGKGKNCNKKDYYLSNYTKFIKTSFGLSNLYAIIKISKKDNMALTKLPYIYYLFYFLKNKKNKMRVLINSVIKIHAITSVYILKLGLSVRHSNVRA